MVVKQRRTGASTTSAARAFVIVVVCVRACLLPQHVSANRMPSTRMTMNSSFLMNRHQAKDAFSFEQIIIDCWPSPGSAHVGADSKGARESQGRSNGGGGACVPEEE